MWQDLLFQMVAWLLLFAGVSTTVTPAQPALPPPTTQAAEPSLLAAFSFAPPRADLLFFTNWQAIKAQQSAAAITSASPLDERMDLLRVLNGSHAGASGFALAYLATQAEQWGWDSTDLLWEATIQGEGPPVYVLRLRGDYDMAALLARFEARDFTRTEQDGAIVYTHPLDLTVPWRTELAVFNAAVLPDEHILIHASGAEPILSALAAHAGADNWQGDAAATAVAASLGPTYAAVVAVGAQTCMALGVSALPGVDQLSPADLAAVQRAVFGEAPLHAYGALGIGYRYEDGRPLGFIVLHYPDGAVAQLDLEPRRQLAAEGQSIAARAPVAEALFSLQSTGVQGGDLVLTVRPADDRPQRLFQMFYRRDMPFAACS